MGRPVPNPEEKKNKYVWMRYHLHICSDVKDSVCEGPISFKSFQLRASGFHDIESARQTAACKPILGLMSTKTVDIRLKNGGVRLKPSRKPSLDEKISLGGG